jgi:hypothetical protein
MSGLRRRDLALLALSVAPLVYTLFDSSDGDVPYYHERALALAAGGVPYRDWIFEYPPYALIWLVLPGALQGYALFRALFSVQVLALDLLARVILLRDGARLTSSSRLGRLTPFLLYSFLGAFQSYFYLKRLDAIAAAIVVISLVAFSKGRMATAGALLALATGTKLYPALAAPALFCMSLRYGKGLRFVGGAVAALLPLAALSAVMPWWRFASYHTARGLLVESTYGSVIWFLHFFGVEASWTISKCCVEVHGPLAQAVLPVARVLFGAATLGAVGLSVARVWPRTRGEVAIDALARIVLLTIASFMTFSIVLSPQFAIWLVGPAAIGVTRERRAPLVVVGIAVMLTALVFPAPGYFTASGITFVRTLILLARNASLLVAVVLLARSGQYPRVAPEADQGTA